MKKVLVTGGAGFIGTNLVRLLLEQRPDWRLTVVDLLTYAGNLENISELIDAKQIDFLNIDIVDLDRLRALFDQQQFELVFHLAAESHVDRSIHNAAAFVQTNVVGTYNLIECARRVKSDRFVHISTDEVYGALGPTGRFVETTPLDPTSPYSASKAASDLLVQAFNKTHNFPGIITRCTNNYGPYQFPEKFIPLFITNALEQKKLPLYGDGQQIRSWIHVLDHARGLLAASERGKIGEVYNLGGFIEAELPNLHVAEQILGVLNKPRTLIEFVEDRLAHDRRYAVDPAKANRELGWTPQIAFESGLKSTIEWYLNNRSWWEKIKSGEYQQFYQKHYGK